MVRKFSNNSERRKQVSIVHSSVSYPSVFFIHLGKSRFVKKETVRSNNVSLWRLSSYKLRRLCPWFISDTINYFKSVFLGPSDTKISFFVRLKANITFEHVKDSLKKAKFLEIDCDEIPVPFAVLQGY